MADSNFDDEDFASISIRWAKEAGWTPPSDTDIEQEARAKAIQANEIAYTVIEVAQNNAPAEFVTLDFRYGIADALWEAGYRKVTPASPATREALAFRLFSDESGQSEGFTRRIWENHPDEHPVKRLYFDRADALLAAFDIRERSE